MVFIPRTLFLSELRTRLSLEAAGKNTLSKAAWELESESSMVNGGKIPKLIMKAIEMMWHFQPILTDKRYHKWRAHFPLPLVSCDFGSHPLWNGNPLQCSCLENPRDRGAWWAAVSGVAQSRTQLKQLSSSSSHPEIWASMEATSSGMSVWNNNDEIACLSIWLHQFSYSKGLKLQFVSFDYWQIAVCAISLMWLLECISYAFPNYSCFQCYPFKIYDNEDSGLEAWGTEA